MTKDHILIQQFPDGQWGTGPDDLHATRPLAIESAWAQREAVRGDKPYLRIDLPQSLYAEAKRLKVKL